MYRDDDQDDDDDEYSWSCLLHYLCTPFTGWRPASSALTPINRPTGRWMQCNGGGCVAFAYCCHHLLLRKQTIAVKTAELSTVALRVQSKTDTVTERWWKLNNDLINKTKKQTFWKMKQKWIKSNGPSQEVQFACAVCVRNGSVCVIV